MIDKAKNYLRKIQLKNKQKAINKQYIEEGFSDDLLDEQIRVNKLRHEHDLPDESNLVYEEFVQ